MSGRRLSVLAFIVYVVGFVSTIAVADYSLHHSGNRVFIGIILVALLRYFSGALAAIERHENSK